MQTINPLSKRATAVFEVLTRGFAKVGDHRKITESESFMPVCVEAVDTSPQGALIVSVAHYYEQNGDLMADPEVTFMVARHKSPRPDLMPDTVMIFPLSYRQDGLGIDRQYVRWEGEKVFWNLRAQHDLVRFCNQWMENIKQQQYGGKLPRKVAEVATHG